MMCVCIYIYILYVYIHVKVNYAINRIYEKNFRSDLSTQKKPSPLANYLLPVTFCCYLFVLANFVRFLYDYFFYWAFLLISHSAFSLCTTFFH